MRLTGAVQPAERLSSSHEGALVGVADLQLRIVLATPLLAQVLGLPPGRLEGSNLRDLLETPEARRGLEMLLRGVVSHTELSTTPDRQRLVAGMAHDAEGGWLMLRLRDGDGAIFASTQTPQLAGRAAELGAFEEFVLGSGNSLLLVEGSLGIGKTALLNAYQARCDGLGCFCFKIDARATDPTDSAILSALAPDREKTSSLAALFSIAGRLASRRWVLLIDNFDAWMNFRSMPRELFAHLPASCRIVLAARRRAKPSWWGETARPLTMFTLGPLSTFDSLRMATMLDIDTTARAEDIRRAQGHPLSIAALALPPGSTEVREAHALDALSTTSTGGISRDVLEAASLPVRVTEDLLADLLEDESMAATMYDRLTEVCVRDPEDVGLRMPETLREVLRERLRRRNPVRFAALQLRLAQYYAKRLEDGSTAYTPSVLYDLLETLGEHPVLRRVYGRHPEGIAFRRARTDDNKGIDAAARLLADAATAEDIATRIEAGTCTTYVAERGDDIVGIVQFAMVSWSAASPVAPVDRRRAAVKSVLARYGEGPVTAATVLAFVIAEEEVNAWGAVARAIAHLLFGLFMTSRNIVATVVVSDPVRPSRSMPTAEIIAIDGLLVSLQDMRGTTPRTIVADLLNSTEDSLRTLFEPPSSPLTISTESVRAALSNLDELDALATSPLAALEICRGDAPALQLQAVLRDALQTLNTQVADRRLAIILHAVYVDKVGKHEQIAQELGIPYGTFRRHLTRGLERVREVLTQRASRRSIPPSAK